MYRFVNCNDISVINQRFLNPSGGLSSHFFGGGPHNFDLIALRTLVEEHIDHQYADQDQAIKNHHGMSASAKHGSSGIEHLHVDKSQQNGEHIGLASIDVCTAQHDNRDGLHQVGRTMIHLE